MKNNIRFVVWILAGLLALMLPSSGFASEEQKDKPATPTQAIVYKPPLRGAPVGRVGGGTRGVDSNTPVLAALVPEHIGLTLQEQPSLYWYLSKSTAHFGEFTLIDDQSVQPLLEKRIDSPIKAGIHTVRLADHNVHLSIGKRYKWFVAIVLDPNHRSKDIIAGGVIEPIETPETLRSKLDRAKGTDIPYIYAESGIWYDTLSSISDLIDAAPNDSRLRCQRLSLLEQVGLPRVEGE